MSLKTAKKLTRKADYSWNLSCSLILQGSVLLCMTLSMVFMFNVAPSFASPSSHHEIHFPYSHSNHSMYYEHQKVHVVGPLSEHTDIFHGTRENVHELGYKKSHSDNVFQVVEAQPFTTDHVANELDANLKVHANQDATSQVEEEVDLIWRGVPHKKQIAYNRVDAETAHQATRDFSESCATQKSNARIEFAWQKIAVPVFVKVIADHIGDFLAVGLPLVC